MKRKKILFFPADSFPPRITRSFWLAYGLSFFHDVYYLQWHDSKQGHWGKDSSPFLSSPRGLLFSLLTPFSVDRTPGPAWGKLNIVRAPVLLTNVLRRLLGEYRSRELCRVFNRRIMEKLVARVKPDCLFHGDSFFSFPPLEHQKRSVVTDFQDDFDDEHLPAGEIDYYRNAFKTCDKVFAVSRGACSRLSAFFSCPIEFLPNGADFSTLRNVTENDIEGVKKRFRLEGKFVIGYIGGSVWFDPAFFTSLARRVEREIPEARFLIVGSIPEKVEAPNAVYTGFVPPHEVVPFFHAANVGLHLKDSGTSNFYYHSIPLKIVQFSAIGKPFLTSPIKWIEEEKFGNVRCLPPDLDLWIEELKNMRAFHWTPGMEAQWEKYDWLEIGQKLASDIAGI